LQNKIDPGWLKGCGIAARRNRNVKKLSIATRHNHTDIKASTTRLIPIWVLLVRLMMIGSSVKPATSGLSDIGHFSSKLGKVTSLVRGEDTRGRQ
jgi:hypothetical protein